MSKRLRLFVVFLVLAISGLFLYPTLRWYFILSNSQRQLALSSNEQIRNFARDQSNQGLDTLEQMARSNSPKPIPSQYNFLIPTAKSNLSALAKAAPKTWTAPAVLSSFASKQDAYNTFEDHYRKYAIDLKNSRSDILQLGLDLSGGMSVLLRADMTSLAKRLGHTPTQVEQQQAMQQAMEILNNRVDKFGVTEPVIRQQGTDEIAIEIPGPADPARVQTFLTGKGSLFFQIEDTQATQALDQYIANDPGNAMLADGQPRDPSIIPAGDVVMGFYKKDAYGLDKLVNYLVLHKAIGLDGSHITNATVGTDPVTNQPVINFQLDREGADIFYKLTSANVGNTLAIVLDGKVRAGARISEPIRGSVQVTGFNAKDAQDLATVLRTGAMPVDLVVMSQSAVGASLGEDAIRQGLQAITLGFALVVVFMVGYYKVAGLIADLALVLNLIIMVAILSVFNLTLTLTSIAGLILTVGMAVDANVIIYERIKDELRVGKSADAASKSGFRKAFWTIMDSNITTIIAAVFLSQLGTGPVQGFAYTLAVGIVSSLFTALFVSRLIFDFGVEQLHVRKLSIDWSRR